MEYQLKDITLKTVTMNDLSEVVRMWAFQNGAVSTEEAAGAIKWMHENHKQNRLHKIVHICFAVFHNTTNKIIGWCGLDGRNNENKVYLFYSIDQEHRGLGYATACAKKVLEHGFKVAEVEEICGGCAKDNIGSKTVLERIGMKLLDDGDDSLFQYHMTRKDYDVLYNEIVQTS